MEQTNAGASIAAPPQQSDDLNQVKLRKEIEKLEFELKEAKVPFYRRLTFLLPIITAVILAGVTIMQSVIVNRLSTPSGAVKVLQTQLGSHGFNASSLWAIWHVLDERQRHGDARAKELLVGIKSLDYLVPLNYPANTPSYHFIISNQTTTELVSQDWDSTIAAGEHYQWRSEALRYLLQLRSSIAALSEILAENKRSAVGPSGKVIDAKDMATLAEHRDELRKTYKNFSRLVGKNQNFIDAGSYVIEKMFDPQLDD
jgi:hypothetical protein